jgi:hypothetical protein
MDFSKNIKTCLENKDFLAILSEFKLDKDLISNDSNICCSNSSFLFVYLEQSAAFLALSFDRLCKSSDSSYKQCFQLLSINAPPIGKFKKCQINENGTYVLLVYDKSLTAIELPSKWGKYDQYDGSKTNIICKYVA